MGVHHIASGLAVAVQDLTNHLNTSWGTSWYAEYQHRHLNAEGSCMGFLNPNLTPKSFCQDGVTETLYLVRAV